MSKFGFHQHNIHHHRHLGSNNSSSSNGWWGARRKNYLMVLLVLIVVLVINMLLLMPRLHTPDHGSWHLVGFPPSSSSGAGKTLTASNVLQQQQQIQQQQQQQLLRSHGSSSSSSVAAGDFVGAFDANHDGVLGPTEFNSLVQEACRNDRASLSLLQSIRRAVRLAFGLSPTSSSSSSSSSGDRYPCTLTGDLLDTTRRAAAVITGGSSSRGAGSSSSSRGGIKGGGVDTIRAATEKAVDLDSPEGRAAARSAALLSTCSSLTPELAQAAASSDTLLLAAADWAMFELFGVNWLSHVQRAGMDNYLIAALDQRTADFLRSNKLGHCALWSTAAAEGATGDGPLPRQAAAYQPGGSAHRAAAWSKLHVASTLLSWGYNVILSDLDTVWLTDPMPYFQAHVPDIADLVLATDDPASLSMMASSEPGLMVRPDPHAAVNPAVAYLRSTPATQAAVAAWLAEYRKYADSDGTLLPAYEQAVTTTSSSSSIRGLLAAGSLLDSGGDIGPLFPAAVVRGWLQQRQSNGQLAAQPHPTDPSNRLLQLTPSSTAGSSSWSLFGGATRRKAAVGMFTPVIVANGYSWFVQGVGSRAAVLRGRGSSAAAAPGRKLPLAVHLSRSGRSREGRLHRMREANWYADGPRYYTEPKLLSFTLTPYSSTAVTAGLANAPDYPPTDQLSLHIASLQRQLQQFYAAAAVAAALGRVLIMPQMQCYCYRDPDSGTDGPASWLRGSSSSSSSSDQQQQQWSCKAPGDDATAFPFNCTLDQVFSPQLMYHHSAVFAGRPLNFREASFLSNRRTPSWLRHAATRISSGSPAGCDSGDDGSSSSSSSSVVGGKCAQALPGRPADGGNQQVIVPPNLTDAEIVTVLKPFASAKYLQFTDITAVFNGSFANPTHKTEYERWLDKVVQPWCCKPAAGAAAAGAGGSSGLPEVATSVQGWSMVDVKARIDSGSSSGSGSSSSRSSNSNSDTPR